GRYDAAPLSLSAHGRDCRRRRGHRCLSPSCISSTASALSPALDVLISQVDTHTSPRGILAPRLARSASSPRSARFDLQPLECPIFWSFHPTSESRPPSPLVEHSYPSSSDSRCDTDWL